MFKKMKGLNFIVMLVCLIVFISGCGNSENTSSNGNSISDGSNTQPAPTEQQKSPIKIGVLAQLSGPLEGYGKQTLRGLEIGLDYVSKGTKMIAGRPVELIVEDTEGKSDVAVNKATKLLEQDKVDILVGATSSADTLAVLPIAEQYKTVMVVEPAVADSITGANWNKYIFRTARNSSQDAIAAATVIAKPGVKIATIAPDYSFGWDGVAAFKEAAEKRGAKIILEEYAAPDATDFTANIQKIIKAKPDYLYVNWPGSNSPFKQIKDMKVTDKGIKVAAAVADFAALKAFKEVGFDIDNFEGFAIYYYELPKNKVNDFLVEEHKKRYGEPPDLFTPGGMSAIIAIAKALESTGGDTSADKLIPVMEGMSFDTPKGTMTFRKEDHQALQPLYAVKLEYKEGYDYPVPVLIRELSSEETTPPIRNQNKR